MENRVKFIKRAFFYGYELGTLEQLNRDGGQWCEEVGNGEVCAATGMAPGERLGEERLALRELPPVPVEVAVVEERGVSRTGLLHWEGNVYSVPERLQRQKVEVHGFEERLEVFAGGERVVALRRERGKGQRVIRDEHYGPRSGPASRGDSLQQRFEALGPGADAFLRGMARERKGHLREQAEGILGLCEEHGTEAVVAAMARAAAFGAYGYKSVKGIVEREGRGLPEVPAGPAALVCGDYPGVTVEERPLAYYAAERGR